MGIPGTFVSFVDGYTLFNADQVGTVDISATPEERITTEIFSSVGPYDRGGFELFAFKPDVVAPGKSLCSS